MLKAIIIFPIVASHLTASKTVCRFGEPTFLEFIHGKDDMRLAREERTEDLQRTCQWQKAKEGNKAKAWRNKLASGKADFT